MIGKLKADEKLVGNKDAAEALDELDLLFKGFAGPNGLVLSKDEKILYVAETRRNRINSLPLLRKLLARAQIAAGADVIFHASGSTGHGVFEGAREDHALAIGVDSDQYDDMPGVVATSMIKRVDVAVFEAIKGAKDGTFKGGIAALGVSEGAIDYVHEGPHAQALPSDVVARVEALKARVARREIAIPTK